VNPLFCVLAFTVFWIFMGAIFYNLNSLSAVRLLGAVLRYHEQLADVILKKKT
jgi:hypothetical protein